MKQFPIFKKLFLILGAIYLLSIILENVFGLGILMPCVVKTLFHMDCLACGTTRAIFTLLSGEILQSWKLNPLGIIFFILFICIGSTTFLLKLKTYSHEKN